MGTQELYLLSPELLIGCFALFIIILGTIFKFTKITYLIAIIGTVASLCTSIYLLLTSESQIILYNSYSLDDFSLFLKTLIFASLLVVLIMSISKKNDIISSHSEYISLLFFSALGLSLLVSSVELITIYISIELATIPLSVLAAFHTNKNASEAGLKFLIMGGISSAIMLYGMVLLYGLTGSLTLDGISSTLTSTNNVAYTESILWGLSLLLILAGIGFKIATVPFHMWAPDFYQAAPTPVTTFIATASKVAGFAILIRVLVNISSISTSSFAIELSQNLSLILAILAIATMVVGNISAIAQKDIKRLLAYSSIAHAGYILIPIVAIGYMNTTNTITDILSAIVFYLVASLLMTGIAFICINIITQQKNGADISSFNKLGYRNPLIAIALTISLISLIGLPPTAGFIAKIYIFGVAIKYNLLWLAIIGVINSVISAYYYLGIIKAMYFNEDNDTKTIIVPKEISLILIIMSAALVIIGVYPNILLDLIKPFV